MQKFRAIVPSGASNSESEDFSKRHKLYFDFTGEFREGYISERLKEQALWLSTEMSYEIAECVIDRQVGKGVLSSGKIWEMVQSKAKQISEAQQIAVTKSATQPLPNFVSEASLLYEEDTQEVLIYEDGILVKGQKQYRNSKNRKALNDAGKKSRPVTDIAVMPDAKGNRCHLIGGLGDKSVSLPQVIQHHFKTHFTQSKDDCVKNTHKTVNFVAITDGAKQIQCDLTEAFGVMPIRIFDWFHLKKKVNEMCILICLSKADRQETVKKLLQFAFTGKVDKMIQHLQNHVKSRNSDKFNELVAYLTKHQHAIIDYKRRKAAGKTIGSGCVEAAVNQCVALRQKAKAKSWSHSGSFALAILKTQILNNNWDKLWEFNLN